jgi:hypothetical protein
LLAYYLKLLIVTQKYIEGPSRNEIAGSRLRIVLVRFGKIDGALQTEFAHLACYLVGAILSWRLPTSLIAFLQKLEHL